MDSPSSCISAAFCEEKRKKTGTLHNTHTSVNLDEARTPVVFDHSVNPVGVDSNEARTPVGVDLDEATTPVVSVDLDEVTTPVVSVDLDEARTPVDLPIGVDLDEARTPVVNVDLDEATTPIDLPIGVDLDEARTPVDVDLDEATTPVDVDLDEATTPVSLNTLKPFGVISFRYFTEPSTVIAPVMAKILIVAESTRDPEQGTNI
jgi:hypothetical protein